MTRSELIQRLTKSFPQFTVADIDRCVRTILDQLGDHLAQGGRIEIRGFGSFQLNKRPPRIGRNPKTGERVSVPARHAPHFKAGKELKIGVN